MTYTVKLLRGKVEPRNIAPGENNRSFPTRQLNRDLTADPGKTEITIYCMTAKVNGSLPSSVLWEQMKGAKAVLDEDNDAMEDVQSVVARGPINAVIGDGEHAISALQNWIASRVKV